MAEALLGGGVGTVRTRGLCGCGVDALPYLDFSPHAASRKGGCRRFHVVDGKFDEYGSSKSDPADAVNAASRELFDNPRIGARARTRCSMFA
jgi:hypothetical protein